MLWQGESVVAQHSLRADERRERGAGAPAACSCFARIAGNAQEGSVGVVESVGRSGATGVRSQVSLSLTHAAAVSQAVQGHATNGDDAVRALPRARRALVALRW